MLRPAHTAQVALVAATLLLGLALQVADGFYHPVALALLLTALACSAAAILRLPGEAEADAVTHDGDGTTRGLLARASVGERPLVAAVAVAAVTHTFALWWRTPLMYMDRLARTDTFDLLVGAQAALVLLGLFRGRGLARAWFPGVLVLALALGAWSLHASPHPQIDVVEVHAAAFSAVRTGHDPYAMTFRNVYGADSAFYRPDAVQGDRVLFGYPYPPINLLLAAPGHALFGDYRYAQLAALVAAAAFVGYARPGRGPKLAAALLLTTPRVYFVLEQGWIEPIALLLLSATTFAMVRGAAWAPWCGGLLLASKQYLGLGLPLLWRAGRVARGGAWRYVGRAAVAGALVTLPFALWNVRAFVETVILLQAREPFRIDSLSLASWAARAGWGAASFAWAVGGGVATLLVVLRRTPNTPAGFAGGLALSCFTTFTLGSKAFCNYYFFVIGALCCTLAACASADTAAAPAATHPPGHTPPDGEATRA